MSWNVPKDRLCVKFHFKDTVSPLNSLRASVQREILRDEAPVRSKVKAKDETWLQSEPQTF